MKILIVEDDIGIAELITDALDSVSENILVVHNGKDAVGFVIDHMPDLMVLDYSLPDMNASGIIEMLKEKNIEIPTFIISTGQGDERIAVEMMKLGAHDYIVKDTYLLNRIPSVVERALDDIRKDRKLKSAMEAMRLSDQKLLEERRRLANIIKASNVGTWEWNLKTNEAIFNHRWAEIVGYQIEELTPLTFDTWLNLVHPDDIHKSDLAIKDHITGKKDYYEMEVRMHHKNSRWIWVLTRGGITEWDEKGKPLILSGTHQDITDKKNSEELEKEIQIAQEALQFKQNFLANMSHEIRTPLTGILGMAQMLEQQMTSNDQKDYLNTLKNSAHLLTEIINQVLDLSKIESGKVKLNFQPFNLRKELDKVEDFFNSIMNEKNIDFFLHIPDDFPSLIVADRKRITQIIQNLISNAVKFTPGGYVKLTCDHQFINHDELMIRICVEDTGLGIKEESKKHIFIPFATMSETDKRSIDGTGLGLSISRELVKLHGGEMSFESETGKGSSFWFTFTAAMDEKGKTDVLDISNSPNANPTNRKLHILYVEDKMINQKVVGLLIESMGHKVEVANNGKQALDMFNPKLFDLILMDIQMPVMDGITATQKLKEKYPPEKLPPIVGLSANAFEGDREKYLQTGLDEYLTKPFDSEEFKKVLVKYF